MKKDVGLFLYSFSEELGSKGKSFGALIFCVSLFNSIATFFGIMAALRSKEKNASQPDANNAASAADNTPNSAAPVSIVQNPNQSKGELSVAPLAKRQDNVVIYGASNLRGENATITPNVGAPNSVLGMSGPVPAGDDDSSLN